MTLLKMFSFCISIQILESFLAHFNGSLDGFVSTGESGRMHKYTAWNSGDLDKVISCKPSPFWMQRIFYLKFTLLDRHCENSGLLVVFDNHKLDALVQLLIDVVNKVGCKLLAGSKYITFKLV